MDPFLNPPSPPRSPNRSPAERTRSTSPTSSSSSTPNMNRGISHEALSEDSGHSVNIASQGSPTNTNIWRRQMAAGNTDHQARFPIDPEAQNNLALAADALQRGIDQQDTTAIDEGISRIVATKNQKEDITDFPPEILYFILSMLSGHDIAYLQRTSTFFKENIDNILNQERKNTNPANRLILNKLIKAEIEGDRSNLNDTYGKDIVQLLDNGSNSSTTHLTENALVGEIQVNENIISEEQTPSNAANLSDTAREMLEEWRREWRELPADFRDSWLDNFRETDFNTLNLDDLSEYQRGILGDQPFSIWNTVSLLNAPANLLHYVLTPTLINSLIDDFPIETIKKIFLLAAKVGCGRAISTLLRNPNFKEHIDDSDFNLFIDQSIQIALEEGYLEIAKNIINNLDPEYNNETFGPLTEQYPEEFFLLLSTIRSENTEAVIERLSNNNFLNVNNREGLLNTALCFAARYGHIAISQELIRVGANVNATDIQGRTPLIIASIHNNAPLVSALLQTSGSNPIVNINAQIANTEDTALTLAVQRGHSEIVRALLTYSFLDLSINDQGHQALKTATLNNNLEVFQALLNYRPLNAHASANTGSGININEQFDHESNRETILTLAARLGNTAMVETLLENRNLAVGEANQQDAQALILALQNNHLDIARILLERRPEININFVTEDGETALTIASREGYIDLAQQLLRNRNLRLDSEDQGRRALINAAHSGHRNIILELLKKRILVSEINTLYGENTILTAAATEGHTEIVEELRRTQHFNIETNNQGTLALIFAAHNGHLNTVRALLRNGPQLVNINSSIGNGVTALMIAASEGRTEIILELMRDANFLPEENNQLQRALDLAIQNNQVGAFRALTEGIDINAPMDENATFLTHAASRGQFEIIQELLSNPDLDLQANDQGNRALILASQNGHLEVIQELLSARSPGININFAFENIITPLVAAAGEGHTEIIEVLIGNLNINLETNNQGNQALVFAARNGHLAVVQTLLNYPNPGIDINAISNGNTPLIAAAGEGHNPIVQALLANPNLNLETHNQGTQALILAAHNGRLNIVQTLLNHPNSGINVNARVNNSDTPLIAAARGGHAEVVDLIVRNQNFNSRDSSQILEAMSISASRGHQNIIDLLIKVYVDSFQRR